MKTLKYLALVLVLLATATIAEAKLVPAKHMYMFGFSASFNDSVLYITDIQDVQGAWYETKNGSLHGRENYSYQLKTFLEEKENRSVQTLSSLASMMMEVLVMKRLLFKQECLCFVDLSFGEEPNIPKTTLLNH